MKEGSLIVLEGTVLTADVRRGDRLPQRGGHRLSPLQAGDFGARFRAGHVGRGVGIPALRTDGTAARQSAAGGRRNPRGRQRIFSIHICCSSQCRAFD